MAHDIRSIGRNLLLLVNGLLGLVAAAVVVLVYVRPRLFGAVSPEGRTVTLAVRDNAALELAVVISVLLLALDLLYLVYGRRPKAPLQFVPSQAAGGVIKVAREALEAGLRSAGESLDVVTRLRVTVEAERQRRVVVGAFFQAPDGVSIPDASQRLRTALAERFAAMVTPADGTKIDFDIEFVGFSGKLPRPSPPPAEPEEPQAFTGPQYPIPDDADSEDDR
ncbi:MAG: hypothetical protein AAF628_16395 [Planctomycetota bacterium]